MLGRSIEYLHAAYEGSKEHDLIDDRVFRFEVALTTEEREAKKRSLELGIRPMVSKDELPFGYQPPSGLVEINGWLVNQQVLDRRIKSEPEFARWVGWDTHISVSENLTLGDENAREAKLGFLLGYPRWGVESYLERSKVFRKVRGLDPGGLSDIGMFLDEGEEAFVQRFPDKSERHHYQSIIGSLDDSEKKLCILLYQAGEGIKLSDMKELGDFYRRRFSLGDTDLDILLGETELIQVRDPDGYSVMEFIASSTLPDLQKKVRDFQTHILSQYPSSVS